MHQSTHSTPGDTSSEHAVLDASVLGDMFGDEPALINSVLHTFVTGTRSNLAELSQAVAAEDLTAVAALAHKIAGASRMSGALALGYCARCVEQAAKQGDAVAVQQGTVDVHAQWSQVQAAITALPAVPSGDLFQRN